MLLATGCFGCLDTMSKVLVAHYPASALVWLRYILQTVVMAAIFLPRMGLGLLRTSMPGLQLARGLMLVLSSVVFVVALGHMKIAEVASIVFLAPIIVALVGGPLVQLHAVLLCASWILGSVRQILLRRSQSMSPATLLAPFGYTQLLVVMLLGWIVFGELPDGIALIGIALVAGSGLGLILARKAQR